MAKEKKKAKKAKKKGNLDPYVRLPFFIQALLNPHNTPALSPDCLFAPAGAMQTTVGQWLTGSKTS
jgi:hypothetical protein